MLVQNGERKRPDAAIQVNLAISLVGADCEPIEIEGGIRPLASVSMPVVKLFPGLIFLVLGVAFFALRIISEEERNVGFLMEQFSNRRFGFLFGIELVHISVLVQNERLLSR